MHAHRNYWKPAAVGCHWTNIAYPEASISTQTRWDGKRGRVSGYCALFDFQEIGLFPTLALAKQAVAQWAMRREAFLHSWGVPSRQRQTF